MKTYVQWEKPLPMSAGAFSFQGFDMTPAELNSLVLTPALALLPSYMDSIPARRELLAIQFQEDPRQLGRQVKGPARGLWQFEESGGVVGVLAHHATFGHADYLCSARHVAPTARAVYLALQGDPILAAGFARLLLLTDPKPLPETTESGWDCYVRTWRPGKPHPDKWAANWAKAVETVG